MVDSFLATKILYIETFFTRLKCLPKTLIWQSTNLIAYNFNNAAFILRYFNVYLSNIYALSFENK